MKAGRELDALIQQEVFKRPTFHGNKEWFTESDLTSIRILIPRYSTNIADAWLVVEKYPDGVEILKCPDGYICYIYTDEEYRTEAETAPLAICKVALKACGVEEEG
jgi:hypothetical protein